MNFARPARRLVTLLGLVMAAVTLSGCVYLRLLALKNQLGDFDRHFVLHSGEGLQIECRHPVLHDDDLRWLGVEPMEVRRDGTAESWHVRWVKQPPPGANETVEYEVELFAQLVEHRVVAIRIPEKYFEYFPKDLFVNALRSTGSAKIDRKARTAMITTSAEAAPEGPVSPPKLESIDQMMGLPTERYVDGQFLCYMYRYRPQTQRAKARPIEVTFYFDQADGKLRRLVGKLPRGTVSYGFN